MRMLKKTEPEIPISHTREMRQKFLKEVALISSSNIKPHHVAPYGIRTLARPDTSPTDISPRARPRQTVARWTLT